MVDSHKFFNKYVYKGAFHIHSTFSDGTGTIDEISKSAKKVGLDFIIITDHNRIDVKEGVYNGVYVFKGEEISPKSNNHYLAIDIETPISPCQNPQVYIDEVRKQGGFGFAAHPDEYKYRKNNAPAITWTDKNIEPDGIEIWNWFSSWADGYDSSNIFTALYSFLFRNQVVHSPKRETLIWWDFLNNKYKHVVSAIGGVDAHALKRTDYIIPVTIFPYKFLFQTVSNFLFLNEPINDDFLNSKKLIFNAIKMGHNYIVNRQLGSLTPEIYIQNSKERAFAGEFINLDEHTFLNVKIPYKSNVVVLLNGVEVIKSNEKVLKLHISELGKYRVEIYKNNKGYIYSNPISVV